ncbi:MAG: energy-coupling factor ABC transporter ATP-binding protein [Clostridiales Family XIII bacterium]|jgi:energy-coupling factor transport system ATP-binding protein|nr:energy-coupling factor ABC transporter ATP-binding protein [Clostridiales Family XIII bacterium]
MVKIENVTFNYGETSEQCLRGISLRIKKGECVLLCGESGCGKTSVTRLVNGLIPHFYEGEFSGEVVVAGRDVSVTTPDALAGIVGSVFQNPRSQFFSLDTTGEIAFGLENLGLPSAYIRKRVRETAVALGIERLLGRDIFALSGGEKQLVAIASAYALAPKIFVFDEPSSNLDWDAVVELAGIMLRLKQEGRTLIVAEHRLYWLSGLIDRVVCMESGQIKHEWPADEFLTMPESERRGLGLRVLNPGELYPTASIVDPGGFRSEASAAVSGFFHPEMVIANQDVLHHEAVIPGSNALRVDAKPQEQAAPYLKVAGLSAQYGRRNHVLHDISFEVSPGEAVAILGGNGAGKTTMARTLCGLHSKSSGEISLYGINLPAKARAGPFYLVMQESGYQLFTDSVENELLLSKNRRSRPANEKVEDILESLSLTDFRERHPMSLSGGQKQRTAIGTAMAHNAQILIFDEPTSGLDYRNMQRVVAVIERLRAEGKTIFIITHDYELLLAACTRALILEDGNVKSDFPVTCENVNKVREVFS